MLTPRQLHALGYAISRARAFTLPGAAPEPAHEGVTEAEEALQVLRARHLTPTEAFLAMSALDLLNDVFPDPAGATDYGTLSTQSGMDASNYLQGEVDSWLAAGGLLLEPGVTFEGFEHEGMHITNPTASDDGGRSLASPEVYGFEICHTGGGCTAWERKLPDGRQCMLTQIGGCSHELGEGGELYLLGLYDAETGDELGMYEGTVGDTDAPVRIGKDRIVRMSTKTASAPPAPRRGRPPLQADNASRAFAMRLTPAQHDKLALLGGAAWIRERIERARNPA